MFQSLAWCGHSDYVVDMYCKNCVHVVATTVFQEVTPGSLFAQPFLVSEPELWPVENRQLFTMCVCHRVPPM